MALFRPRSRELQKFFSSFPTGWAGIGLLLLRLVAGFGATAHGFSALTAASGSLLASWTVGLLAIAAGVALFIGFLTPLAGAAMTIGYFVLGASELLSTEPGRYGDVLSAFELAAVSMALVLLGPGAISLDARLFGRRVIVIQNGRRSRP
jgi:uncharacterized membrane protein YphA (DoxX/SURF4 family)